MLFLLKKTASCLYLFEVVLMFFGCFFVQRFAGSNIIRKFAFSF